MPKFSGEMPTALPQLYEYFFDGEKKEWIPWANLVPKYVHDPQRKYNDILVPTVDTVRTTWLLKLQVRKCLFSLFPVSHLFKVLLTYSKCIVSFWLFEQRWKGIQGMKSGWPVQKFKGKCGWHSPHNFIKRKMSEICTGYDLRWHMNLHLAIPVWGIFMTDVSQSCEVSLLSAVSALRNSQRPAARVSWVINKVF